MAESIFGEIFTTGSRINVLTAHAQTLLSQKSPKMMSGALNSNMASDLKPEVVIWPKLRMCTEKSPELGKRQRRTVKLSTSYKKSMSLNPFPVTDFRPEVELMHLLLMRGHYCHVSNRRHALRVRLNVILFNMQKCSPQNVKTCTRLAHVVRRTLLQSQLCPSVCLSVCHTSDSRPNGSMSRNSL